MFKPAQTIALVANGDIQDYKKIAESVRTYQQIIAVDGGLNHCDKMGITPDLIIGDFDSTSPELLQKHANIPTYRYPCDKDETDLELALSLCCASATERVTVFGALQLRTDHALANLHLLRRYPGKVRIETEIEIIYACRGTVQLECSVGQTLSLIPMGGPVTGVSSKGLKWELEEVSMDQNFMSISNICVMTPAQLTIQEGDLLCCLYKRD